MDIQELWKILVLTWKRCLIPQHNEWVVSQIFFINLKSQYGNLPRITDRNNCRDDNNGDYYRKRDRRDDDRYNSRKCVENIDFSSLVTHRIQSRTGSCNFFHFNSSFQFQQSRQTGSKTVKITIQRQSLQRRRVVVVFVESVSWNVCAPVAHFSCEFNWNFQWRRKREL